MRRPLQSSTLFGAVLIALSLWSVTSLFLTQQPTLIKGLPAATPPLPLLSQAEKFQLLPGFRQATLILASLLLIMGVGVFRRKRWVRMYAAVYVGIATAVGFILWGEYFQRYGADNVWILELMWGGTLALLGLLVSRSVGLPTSLGMVKMRPFRDAYQRMHWKIVGVLAFAFGISATVVGSLMALWGVSLLIRPTSEIYFNGVYTKGVLQKVIILGVGLVTTVLGITCLVAKKNQRHSK